MKFTIAREALLEPLQTIQGVVERRQTLPILSNLLIVCRDDQLSLTATDMEVELVARAKVESFEPGEVTVPARKLIDICRALPHSARISFAVANERASVRSGKARFVLSTLPAADFPAAEAITEAVSFRVDSKALRRVFELTQFAMAQQDVRYYLNGLFLHVDNQLIRAVATDGHRLALADLAGQLALEGLPAIQVIVPRKAVNELVRLLASAQGEVDLRISSSGVQAEQAEFRFTSKLIDGRFPDYEAVVPKLELCDREMSVERESLRQCLARASILSNDRYRAVRLAFDDGLMRVSANNPEHEEAEDELEVSYTGEPLEVGFNVAYLIDAVSAIPSERLQLFLTDASSSCLIRPEGSSECQYVVMPMRL
jgi:DNA polymerase-3 subunit beta